MKVCVFNGERLDVGILNTQRFTQQPPIKARAIIINGFRCCACHRAQRIGKAVRTRHVPNAVKRMPRHNATGPDREGAGGR